MNKVIISGNLVKDMDVVTTKKTDIGNFTIANNRGFGEDQRTSFIRCALFGKRVESMQEYLLKGAKVEVCGTLEVTSKEIDDEYVNFTTVLVDEIEILKFVNSDEDEEEEEEDKKSKKSKKSKKGKK